MELELLDFFSLLIDTVANDISCQYYFAGIAEGIATTLSVGIAEETLYELFDFLVPLSLALKLSGNLQ